MIDIKSGTPWETIILTTLQRNSNIIKDLLDDARKEAVKLEEGKMVIYNSYGPEWRPFGRPRKRRPFNSVILSKGLANTILNDIKSFLGSEKWYRDRGKKSTDCLAGSFLTPERVKLMRADKGYPTVGDTYFMVHLVLARRALLLPSQVNSDTTYVSLA